MAPSLPMGNLFKILLASSLYDAVFLTSYLNVIINETLQNPTIIAALIAIRRLVRVILDIPLATIIDRILGLKKGLILAVLFKIFFASLLLIGGVKFIFIATVAEGISLGMFRNTIGVMQYNLLEKYNLKHFYSKFNAWYGLFLYFLLYIIGTASNTIYLRGKQTIIMATIVLLLIDILLILDCTKNMKPATNILAAKNNNSTIFDNFAHALRSFFNITNRKMIGLGILLGSCSVGWHINNMNQFLAINIFHSDILSAKIFQLGILFMCFGAIIAIFISSKKIIRLSAIFILILLANCIWIELVGHKILLFFSSWIYFLFFTLYEGILRTEIMEKANPEARCEAISIAGAVSALAGMVMTIMFHFLGQFYNYKFGYSASFYVLLVFALYGFYLVAAKNKNA